MIKTLLNIEENLASSIALRFSGYLNKFIPLNLYIAHVEETGKKDNVGQGLVHQAWEEGVLASGKRLVDRMLRTENIDCPLAGRPRITVGNREEEIIYQLRSGQYELYIEGYLNTSDPEDFFSLINSPLFTQAPCPILVTKNLSISKRCALLCADSVDPELLVKESCKILRDSSFLFDIVYFKFKENESLAFLDRKEAGSHLKQTEQLLANHNSQVEEVQVLSGTPEQVGDYLKKYALVVSTFPGRKSMRMMTLANSLASVLLVK